MVKFPAAIPTHNDAWRIKRSLEAVLNQTLADGIGYGIFCLPLCHKSQAETDKKASAKQSLGMCFIKIIRPHHNHRISEFYHLTLIPQRVDNLKICFEIIRKKL